MDFLPSYGQLKSLTDEELIERYNDTARSTVLGTPLLAFYRDELFRRTQARQSAEMLAFTKQMRNMTVAITLLTIANFVLVVFSLAL